MSFQAKYLTSVKSSLFQIRTAMTVFVLIFLFFGVFSGGAQEPVTGGKELINWVARIKKIDYGINLEWLYLENRVDFKPDQIELVRSGQPLKFGTGYLYHGRDGLDEVLIREYGEGDSYLTRAPHVWAVGAFHNKSRSPAILMIKTEDFNKLRDQGKAVLEAEIDRKAGVMDPYPRIPTGIPLKIVREIWIDEDTEARYRKLVETQDGNLSPEQRSLRNALIKWSGRITFSTIQGLHHSELDRDNFYPVAYDAVGRFFVKRHLDRSIPGLQLRK